MPTTGKPRLLDHVREVPHLHHYSIHTDFPQLREDIDKPKELVRLREEILPRFRNGTLAIKQVKQRLRQESLLFIERGNYREGG
jgi:hypothetical protein